MFYDRFIQLCARKNVAPTRAALDAGISKSLVTKWKENKSKEPSPEVVRKLADYFGLPAVEVLDDIKKEPGTVSDSELSEDERTMLEAFRRLSPERREDSLVQLRALADKQ